MNALLPQRRLARPLHEVLPLLEVLDASYQRMRRRPLGAGACPSSLEQAPLGERLEWLHTQAPFMLLAQDTQADPVYFYSNATASERFGYSAEEFLVTPARFSAPPEGREERAELIERTYALGFTVGYSGVRVTKTGRLFRIHDVELWVVHDATGILIGLGALVWTAPL
ncbi:MEKHLA domain-containing protein [Myxococcus stipitatus]|uniref:MEKHLA domain-containing protein n=1 Tax=Myxococcus stipitatus TaxID=83455 RepID=UPI0007C5C008|nr:MEKHLA domain-containing protein [Myxococcus stipitatus]